MSGSFVHGGLDRESFSWLREDGLVDQHGVETNSRVAGSSRTNSERPASQSYIYAGLDRTPVRWTHAY
jgi:hypothetical protein